MEPWKITRERGKAEVCSRNGCALAGEPEYYAVLDLPECIRRLVCLTCFHELKSQAGDHAGEMPFHWKVRRRPDGRKQAMLDMTSLRVLFDRLGDAQEDAEEGDPDQVETDEERAQRMQRAKGLRYLVALMLLRKRMLKTADARNKAEEAADLLVVDPKIEGMEPVALTAPSLEEEALAALQEEMMAAIGAPPGQEGDAQEAAAD